MCPGVDIDIPQGHSALKCTNAAVSHSLLPEVLAYHLFLPEKDCSDQRVTVACLWSHSLGGHWGTKAKLEKDWAAAQSSRATAAPPPGQWWCGHQLVLSLQDGERREAWSPGNRQAMAFRRSESR